MSQLYVTGGKLALYICMVNHLKQITLLNDNQNNENNKDLILGI